MTLRRDIIALIGRAEPVIETATVTTVASSSGLARVTRAGQSNETRFIPLSTGVSCSTGDVVEIVKFNNNINTALIRAVIR